MTKKRWTEDEIEKTLSDLPALKDNQSKESLMQAIEEKNKDAALLRSDKKKKPPWVMPAVAAAAALFLIAILLPSMLNGGIPMSGDNNADQEDMAVTGNEASDNSENMPVDDADGEEEQPDAENNVNAPGESDRGIEVQETIDVQYPVFSTEVVVQETDFVIGIQPIIAGTAETLEQAVLTTLRENDPTSGEGFSELSSVEVTGSQATLFFEEESLRGLTSAEHQVLSYWFDEVFTLFGITEFNFSTPEGAGIQFGQVGDVTKMDVSSENRGYYLTEYEGEQLIVSARTTGEEGMDDSEELLDLEELFEKMTVTEADSDWYFAATELGFTLTGTDISDDEIVLTYTIDPEMKPEERELFYQAYRFAVAPFEVNKLTFVEEGSSEERIYLYEDSRIVETDVE